MKLSVDAILSIDPYWDLMKPGELMWWNIVYAIGKRERGVLPEDDDDEAEGEGEDESVLIEEEQ